MRFIVFLFLILLASTNSFAFAQQDTVWSSLYMRDLDRLRTAIATNHPGAIDARNPEFARTLDVAYREARDLAPRINSFAALRLGLTRFINQFEDEHLQIGFTQQLDSMREAGLGVQYRNNNFYVVDADSARYSNAAQLTNALLLSCGGIAARQLFIDRVLWWRGRVKIEADWYRYAPLLFIDYGPPLPPAPRHCVFESRGQRIALDLKWKNSARDEINATLQRTNPVRERTIGVQRVADKALWFHIPTFAINREPQLGLMRSALDSLRKFVATGSWDLIVFDLRNNTGGSSSWGDQIAQTVFGQEWARQAASYLFDGTYTEYRLSEDNIKAMRGVLQQIITRDGPESTGATSWKALTDSAEAALTRGEKYYGIPRTRAGVAPPRSVRLPGQIVVISTASCFSACLDFLDRMRLHNQVIQVGETTGVDTNYMENWGGPISDLTNWSYPMKVYRNRRRANNEAYPPHVRYEGALQDDDALRAWILRNYRSWRRR